MGNFYIGNAKGLALWTRLFFEDVMRELVLRAEKEQRDREIYDALKRRD